MMVWALSCRTAGAAPIGSPSPLRQFQRVGRDVGEDAGQPRPGPFRRGERGGWDERGEEQDAVPVNLLIAKQRNGPTGDVHLTFLKSYTRFESAAKVSDEDVPTEK